MPALRSCSVPAGGDGVCRAERLVPHSVVPAGHVGALVRVRAKEVALGLNQVGGQAGPARACMRVRVRRMRVCACVHEAGPARACMCEAHACVCACVSVCMCA
jgi:hypothetical protein